MRYNTLPDIVRGMERVKDLPGSYPLNINYDFKTPRARSMRNNRKPFQLTPDQAREVELLCNARDKIKKDAARGIVSTYDDGIYIDLNVCIRHPDRAARGGMCDDCRNEP